VFETRNSVATVENGLGWAMEEVGFQCAIALYTQGGSLQVIQVKK